MGTKHTSGPWRATRKNWRSEPDPHRIYISGDAYEDVSDGEITTISTAVCIVEGNATSPEVTAANAALIEAAPDMLHALQLVRDYGSHGETDEGESVSYFVEAAIAKATGDTP